MKSKQIIKELSLIEGKQVRAIITKHTVASIFAAQRNGGSFMPKSGFTGSLFLGKNAIYFEPDDLNCYILSIPPRHVDTLHIQSLRHYVY